MIFLKPNNPLLRKTAKEIPLNKISSKNTKDIIQKMLKIAYGEQGDKKKAIMVGLAAVQIGILKKIILVDTKANGTGEIGDIKVYINPEIIWKSKTKMDWYEGCYSVPEVCGIVSRSISIKIQGFALYSQGVATLPPPRWNFIEEKYTGYIARIFQHEIDHLNGKFFVDLIINPDNLHHVKPADFPSYRNKQAWRNWSEKYPLPLNTTS